MKKLLLLIGSPASNPAGCRQSLKEEDCLQTWVLLKVGDMEDNEGVGGLRVPLMQTLYMLVLLTPRSRCR